MRAAPARSTRWLIVLVLLGSALCLVLALTRPVPEARAALPGTDAQGYVAAPLAGPTGPAVEAMVAALPAALGYDVRRLDAGLREATALMTDAFAQRFTESFDATARPVAIRQRAVVEARVRGAGVVRSVSEDVVLTLAYVDQVLVRGRPLPEGGAPQVIERYRVLVRMVRTVRAARESQAQWRIADIRPVA